MALFQQSESQSMEQERGAMEAASETTADPAIVAAGASVLLAWHQYFLRGNREMGLFVGLWPPTILAFASYFRQTNMYDRMQRLR